jgi:two-component system, response regulator PdtaR
MPIYSLRSVNSSALRLSKLHAKHSSQNSFALRMKVTIRQEAVADLGGIFAWVARNDPVRADRKSGSLTRRPAGSSVPIAGGMGNYSFPAALPSVTTEPKTVVVAEDEAVIRVLTVAVLTEGGFIVIEAGHAEEALAALQLQPLAIHLLFTDINMPGAMNGLALAHHVQAAWPHIALLITSGDDKPQHGKLPTGSVFLAKPYDPAHVLAHAQALTGA